MALLAWGSIQDGHQKALKPMGIHWEERYQEGSCWPRGLPENGIQQTGGGFN